MSLSDASERKFPNLKSVARSLAATNPTLRNVFMAGEAALNQVGTAVASVAPSMIRARPQKVTIAITAYCNLRCIGCRYGRDFMPGSQLDLDTVTRALDDARAVGVETVRLYGGEPLLHPDLAAMVRHSVDLGLKTYVTTNGILLGRKIDSLYKSGLRSLSIGFYGMDDAYDSYVQRTNHFRHLRESLVAVRQRYGSEIHLQLNYLIMKPTVSLEALHAAWNFAETFDMSFHTDLVHYSLPYFTEGPDRILQFSEEDRPAIEALTAELVRLKAVHPERMTDSIATLRSTTDWLLRGSDMRIPCDAGKLLWIGADGSVQLCYVTFPLGNLHTTSLRDMVLTKQHHDAARDAFLLNCPNCHCERDCRVTKHAPSFIRYSL